jgi:uncharacterized protein
MAEHPNVAVLRRGYEAFAAGDAPTLRSLWTADITWHIRGTGQLDGEYRGPDEVFNFVGKLTEETGGTNRLDVHAILADDEHGVVLVTSHSERNGKSLSANVVHVHHLRAGKVQETWFAITDPAEALAFWE